MIVQMYYPNILPPAWLDQYLARGWFRSSSMLFATKLICLDEDVHSVVNIRLPLSDFRFKKRLRKLFNRNKERFTYTIGRPSMTAEKERLYEAHKKRFKGFVLDTLEMYLYANDPHATIFDSHEICVYDGNKLVALSYCDLGNESAAGIIGIYDVDYEQYSLGTYTMLIELNFAQDREIKYYYPGYVLDGNSCFDYKLRLGDYEFYDWEGNWKPIGEFQPKSLSADIIKEKIAALSTALEEKGVTFKKLLYPYFFSGYLDVYQVDLFKSPIFISLYPDLFGENALAIAYSLEHRAYRLSFLKPNSRMRRLFFESPYLMQARDPDIFADNVYQYEELLLVLDDAELMASKIDEVAKNGLKQFLEKGK